ncbi:MAG: hypothetical protein M3O70_23810 [Actinomycetota bacterium]|nr:hypothetical protein [Actinomycetota bacterium]
MLIVVPFSRTDMTPMILGSPLTFTHPLAQVELPSLQQPVTLAIVAAR